MRRPLGLLAALTTLAVAVTLAGAAPGADAVSADGSAKPKLGWKRVDVDTGQQFRGLAVVDAKTAWVGGSKGGVWTTVDAGKTWEDVSPPGARAKKLLFRDVEAADAMTAQVLAIGEGRDSRIYRTTDGGAHWTKTFVNDDPKAFYDCLAMYPDGEHGLAMSDPVHGKFRIIATDDGGKSWDVVSRQGMPKAVKGEFGFAASGTCLIARGEGKAGRAYLASGGAAARVFVSKDYGQTWRVRNQPIPATPAGGVFSLAFGEAASGIAVGGDFEAPDNGVDASAYTRDGGRSWNDGGDLGGYRSGVAYRDISLAVAVGPSGSDVTTDGAISWTTFSKTDFDAVQCVDGTCWASGPEGAVGLLVTR